MSALVIDASAALKLLTQELGRADVRKHLQQRTVAGEEILVPPLFWLELVNVLAHRYRYPPDAIVEAVYELEHLEIVTADVGRPVVLAVIDAVGRTGLTAYDAAYLVLAESADAQLITADARLAAAAGDRAILVGPERSISEKGEAYDVSAISWADWKGAAAYLSELRSTLCAAEAPTE